MSERKEFAKYLSGLVYIVALVNVAGILLFTGDFITVFETGIYAGFSVIIAVIFYGLLLYRYRPWVVNLEEDDFQSIEEATDDTIMHICPEKPFVVHEATPINISIKNPSPTKGLRIRFYTTDHVSPRSVDIAIDPQQETQIRIQVIPLLKGEREIVIEFAPLFNSAGKLIPSAEADQIVTHRFKYSAREASIVGVTSSQMNTLKKLIKVATGLVFAASFANIFLGGVIGGYEELIRTFIPLLITLQVPILFVHFALQNKLPVA